MPRRYRRRRFGNRDKYSIEHTVFNTPSSGDWTKYAAVGVTAPTQQISFPVLPPTVTQGMRKVKHFTMSFNASDDTSPIAYALVYVPENYEVNRINLPGGGSAVELYEPNQFVISSGILDFSGGPLRIRSRLSRNLNSGDSVFLVFSTYQGVDNTTVLAEITYAITLQ